MGISSRLVVTLLVLMFISLCASGIVSRQNIAERCGKPYRGAGFIIGGDNFKRGDYPWNVALMWKNKTPPEFFCGATLISLSHVITAAHCIQSKGRQDKRSASEVIAIFGAHNLTDDHEVGKLSLTPESIQIHEDWNTFDESYDADIAMLTFKAGSIKNTMFIQPICLWKEEQKEFPLKIGTFVGWGQRQHRGNFEPIPSKLTVLIHTNEDCFSENYELESLSSQRTFCGGAGDGTGPCFYDSGSSVVIKVESTFYLRGIFSSILLSEIRTCDLDTYQIYTDAFKYLRWMQNKMNKVVCKINMENESKSCVVDHQDPV